MANSFTKFDVKTYRLIMSLPITKVFDIITQGFCKSEGDIVFNGKKEFNGSFKDFRDGRITHIYMDFSHEFLVLRHLTFERALELHNIFKDIHSNSYYSWFGGDSYDFGFHYYHNSFISCYEQYNRNIKIKDVLNI